MAGFVIYEGKSRLSDDNIVGIITEKSVNKKTGNMSQLWILSKDILPTENSKQVKDFSICGDCKLRQSLNGACYVNIGQGPNAVYKSYKNGNYSYVSDFSIFKNIKIRFGAYGDPYALPFDILHNLKKVSKNNTSYTHQWRKDDAQPMKELSMASVDNINEAYEASKLGWRYFRISKDDVLLDNEIICPNLTKGVQCIDCNLCSGQSTKAKNIVVSIHGSLKKRF